MSDTLSADPKQWIANLPKPSWDEFFLGLAMFYAIRSPDQETKQGCVIVDWDTKTQIGAGFNGHPAGHSPTVGWGVVAAVDLPTKRPEKYFCMVHADANAAISARGTSQNAVVYLPMQPCEVCLGLLNNLKLRDIRVRRIVYLEHRTFPKTMELSAFLPEISIELYRGLHPAIALENAATYARIRTQHGVELSKASTTTYAGAVTSG